MADFISLAILVFVTNLMPMFMPPTWIILSLASINDPSFDPLALAFVGAIFSTIGRFGLSFYTGFFRRFLSKELAEHAEQIRQFFEKKSLELFFGTFLYALSPFPSNLIFIADGLTKVDSKPIFAGFFIGRLISYFLLISASSNLFDILGGYSGNQELLRYGFDIIGILAAFSILLVDWKKVLPKKTKK
jgi:uncharacterized membrane protein YdjX (TVP38/TMEM64 family)